MPDLSAATVWEYGAASGFVARVEAVGESFNLVTVYQGKTTAINVPAAEAPRLGMALANWYAGIRRRRGAP